MESHQDQPVCKCSGLRVCYLCRHSERAKAIEAKKGATEGGLFGPETVVARHFNGSKKTGGIASSCCFASFDAASSTLRNPETEVEVLVHLWMCGECLTIVPLFSEVGSDTTTMDGCRSCEVHKAHAAKYPWAIEALRCHQEHVNEAALLGGRVDGLYYERDFITEEEELRVVDFLDEKDGAKWDEMRPLVESTDTQDGGDIEATKVIVKRGWKDSQSGRRKQDWGPAANFKKRKAKLAPNTALPLEMKPFLDHVSSHVAAKVKKVTLADIEELQLGASKNDGKTQGEAVVVPEYKQPVPSVEGTTPTTQQASNDYTIVETSCLEYTSSKLSNLDPHIDDTFMWGPRVAGVSFLERCIITFVHMNGVPVHIELERRALYVISAESRYIWLHGIRAEHCQFGPRRLSITMRELSDDVKQTDPAISERIVKFAATFA